MNQTAPKKRFGLTKSFAIWSGIAFLLQFALIALAFCLNTDMANIYQPISMFVSPDGGIVDYGMKVIGLGTLIYSMIGGVLGVMFGSTIFKATQKPERFRIG